MRYQTRPSRCISPTISVRLAILRHCTLQSRGCAAAAGACRVPVLLEPDLQMGRTGGTPYQIQKRATAFGVLRSGVLQGGEGGGGELSADRVCVIRRLSRGVTENRPRGSLSPSVTGVVWMAETLHSRCCTVHAQATHYYMVGVASTRHRYWGWIVQQRRTRTHDCWQATPWTCSHRSEHGYLHPDRQRS